MKEVTRIHLAKVAYDIELPAKHELERYIAGLQRKINDEEVMRDIELRMVELLGEHGVQAGSVITKTEVGMLRSQLGESDDIETDDEPRSKSDADGDPMQRLLDGKKLYRDTDNALVAGVLSGLAAYLHADPTIVRLGFIVLLFATHILPMTMIYILLAVIVAPARTASQKMEMRGRAITAESLREFSEQLPVAAYAGKIRTVILAVAGIISIMLAGLALMASFAIVLQLVQDTTWMAVAPSMWLQYVLVALMSTCGVLAAWFFIRVAQACFAQKWTSALGRDLSVLVTVGLLCAMTVVVLGYGAYSGLW